MEFECHGSEAPQWAEQVLKAKEVKEGLGQGLLLPRDVPDSTNTAHTGLLLKRDLGGFIGRIFEDSVSSFLPSEFKKTKLI